MDMSMVVGAFEGTKAIYNGIQTLLDIKEAAAVRAKAAELLALVTDTQGKLFTVQADYAAAASRINELEAQVMRLEQWELEKDRYGLHALAVGTFVYRLKASHQGEEPPHDICPSCYQDGVKSILQYAGYEIRRPKHLCPKCKAVFLGESGPMGEFISIPRDRGGF